MSTEELNCDEIVELVTAYLENALDEHTRHRVEQHLATCSGCDRYLEQIRRTIAELGRLPAEHLSSQARADLLTAFHGWRSGQPERSSPD
jgi:anti-sigma factor RsiW